MTGWFEVWRSIQTRHKRRRKKQSSVHRHLAVHWHRLDSVADVKGLRDIQACTKVAAVRG